MHDGSMIPWGPTGEIVYKRTYSRTKANGDMETWPETVARVARGNMALVYGNDVDAWSEGVTTEYEELVEYMTRFAVVPAGRHLWASGVRGRQYLFNCHVSGFGNDELSEHFDFSFLRLMEGGGVGANYSTKYLREVTSPRRELSVHIVCDPAHPDYAEMKAAGILSNEYHHEWEGSYPVEDSREGWAAALVDLIDTFTTPEQVLHFNRVYDVSRVRAKGQPLRTFGGTASGPQPFGRMMRETGSALSRAYRTSMNPIIAMDIDHAVAECVVSGGVRRSARMSILHWQDPWIMDFINIKTNTGSHWTTNISVEIDDEFIEAYDDIEHPLHYHAFAVHYAVVGAMLENGEPGYWNSSHSNVNEIDGVIATNPCGEIALPAWGACVLAHVNLDAFAPRPDVVNEDGEVFTDHAGIERAHLLATRFAIRATFGDMSDPKQKEVMDRERRIGVGHLGVQSFLVKNGIPYSEAESNGWFQAGLRFMKATVRTTARDYAFELRIPEPIKVTTVAPTGSTAKLPGVTEGIHPIYARYFERRVRFSINDPKQADTVLEANREGFAVETDQYDASGNTMIVVYPTKEKLVGEVEDLGLPAELVESADELSLRTMLGFQVMYQELYADNAVSMTSNIQPGAWPNIAEVMHELIEALPRLKGTTIMVDGTRPQAPYTRITEEEYLSYGVSHIEDGTDEDCATGACPVR